MKLNQNNQSHLESQRVLASPWDLILWLAKRLGLGKGMHPWTRYKLWRKEMKTPNWQGTSSSDSIRRTLANQRHFKTQNDWLVWATFMIGALPKGRCVLKSDKARNKLYRVTICKYIEYQMSLTVSFAVRASVHYA